MTRDVSAPLAEAVGGTVVRIVHLLEIDFDPWIYLTDAPSRVSWNGHQYLPSQYLGFDAVTESHELLVNECVISLSGVDQSVLSALLQETYLFRRVRIRLAAMTEGRQVDGDPLLIFEGRMDKPRISVSADDGTISAAVTCASHWSDAARTNGRHSNSAEQRRLFPDDAGFDFVATMEETIFWGSEEFNNYANYVKAGPGQVRFGKSPTIVRNQ